MSDERLFDAESSPEAGASAEVTIRPDPRRSDCAWVCVGGRRKARISLDQVGELGVGAGTIWDESLAERVETAAARQKGRDMAMRWLAARRRSGEEIVRKLRQKGVGADVARGIVADLERAGLVDDEAYAVAMVEGELRRRPAGARLLEARLLQKGVDRDLARRVVREQTSGRDAFEDALALAERKVRSSARVQREVLARRVMAQLARRGFEADICRRATQRALRLDEAEEG